MEEFYQSIENYYTKENLFETIFNKLKKVSEKEDFKREDLSSVDEFHVRGAEVTKELVKQINLENLKVLDLGCGIGGTSRMLAEEYNCEVSGIDLNKEYIRTAELLTDLLGLEREIDFIVGNALDLPFKNDSFDAIVTQHVQMNIKDKEGFYTEIARTLRTNGYFLCYEILLKKEHSSCFPLPWASDSSHSFLFKSSDLEKKLMNLNFHLIHQKDQTIAGILFFEKVLSNDKKGKTPNLGLHLLMGENTKEKITNLQNHLKNGDLQLMTYVFQKK
jgi:SAM-dependent methyltransferase